MAIGAILLPDRAGAQNSAELKESFAVFTAVLDSLYRSQGDAPAIVLVADSLYWRPGGVAFKGRLLVPHRAEIDPATIASFDTATSKSVGFPPGFRYGRKLHIYSTAEYEETAARGMFIDSTTTPRVLQDMGYWVAFVEKYPRAWGVTALSRVGFNAARTEALIYVRHQCGGGCGSGEAILLRKRGSKWEIQERIGFELTERFGIGSLRYLGPGAHLIAQQKKAQDSTRRAVADSIKRDRMPRRIRGTVINRGTGTPMADAQIFAHSPSIGTSGIISERITRYTADSRGHFEIQNPPLGTLMIEVQCPGSMRRDGATLDAPGMYVRPMLDTVLTVGPPNVMPCWNPKVAHRIVSGELEGAVHTASPYPLDQEARVYSALVDALFGRGEAKHILIDAYTRSWCGRYHECPRLNVAHLERAAILDSVTVSAFRRTAELSVPLNPRWADSIGSFLLSPGERAYLRQDGGLIAGREDDQFDTGFWRALQMAYPSTSALVSFTRVGFNSGRTQAIVGTRTQTSDEDRKNETLLLERDGDSWRVARRHLEREQITGKNVRGVCEAAIPGSLPSREELATLDGDYDFTLVSSAVDSRVIKWRMRFVPDTLVLALIRRDTAAARRILSAGPIMPAFQVIDPSSGARRKDLEPGTYLSAGKVHFNNAANMLQFDGFGNIINIRGLSDGLLFGQWEHYSFGIAIGKDGRAIPEPAGHFCAVKRVTPQRD